MDNITHKSIQPFLVELIGRVKELSDLSIDCSYVKAKNTRVVN